MKTQDEDSDQLQVNQAWQVVDDAMEEIPLTFPLSEGSHDNQGNEVNQVRPPRLAMKALGRGVPLQGLGGCVGRCVGEPWAEGREEVNLTALIFLLAWTERSLISNVF